MSEHIYFDKLVNRYVIKGELIAIDPIHIGNSGNDTINPIDVDNSVLKDSRGYAIIPGSSLKGVLRSLFESVIRKVNDTNGYDKIYACDILDKDNCCTAKESKNIRTLNNPKEKAELAYKSSCVTCRLFGGREIAGRLLFKDCVQIVEDGIPVYEYRDGVGIDRNTGSAKPNAKFDYEIVPAGTKFDFCLFAENITKEQIIYRDFIIKQLRSGNVAVGGKTTRGLGRIKLISDNYDQAKQKPEALVNELKSALEKAKEEDAQCP